MSRENVETIARLYDEFLGRPERLTRPEIVEFFDPDVELRQSASLLGTAGTFRGYDGLRQATQEVFETFREAHWVPERLVDSGDEVVAMVEFRALGRESGAKVAQMVGHVWTLRDGRIIAWHVYLDPAQALEAVGLRE